MAHDGDRQSPDLSQYRRRRSALRTERDTWFEHWKQISQYVYPRRGRYFTSDRNKGSKKHQDVVNNTAAWANNTLASGMLAGISSPARPWFRLKTPLPELNERNEVKRWLQIVERNMREVFSGSNFYNSVHTLYSEQGAFGSGAMLILEDDDDVIRCFTLTAGEFYVATNDRHQVDTLYRDYSMTVDQLVRRFGIENVSTHVRDLHKRGVLDTWVDVVQIIEPREVYKAQSSMNRDMPFRSVHFELGGDNTATGVLAESGFMEFPAACPRWEVLSDDVYGTSPGMYALGDVKQLQVQEKRKGQAIDKMSNPPMVGPPGLQRNQVSLLPGGITFLDAQSGSGAAFTPAYTVDPRINELMMDIEKTENRIKETFYTPLFLSVLNSDRRMITAREIEERHQEKLLMLGPVLERQHNELLDVVIDRTFAVMGRRGLIPPAPPDLQGIELDVEYISVLAQAQKAVAIDGINQLAAYVQQSAAVQPEILDKVDWDQTVDEYGDALGVPATVVRADDDVEQVRQARAQQQQQMMAAEQAAQSADVAKTMSDTEVSEGTNLLQQLTGVPA